MGIEQAGDFHAIKITSIPVCLRKDNSIECDEAQLEQASKDLNPIRSLSILNSCDDQIKFIPTELVYIYDFTDQPYFWDIEYSRGDYPTQCSWDLHIWNRIETCDCCTWACAF